MLKKIWDNLEEGALCLLLVVMVMITFVTVITRYVFDYPLSYIDQFVPNLLVWVTFLGSSAAMKRKAHLGLSMVYDLFPASIRPALDVLILLGTGAFFCATAWYGWKVVILQMENRMMASLGYPSWIVGLAVPVGSILLVIRGIETWSRHRRCLAEPGPGTPGI